MDKFEILLPPKSPCLAKSLSKPSFDFKFTRLFRWFKNMYLLLLNFSIETGKLATNELPLTESDKNGSNSTNNTPVFNHATIAEDEEVDCSSEPKHQQVTPNEKKYTWRVDLSKSEQYWAGWFENLSAKFLDLRVPKLLLLASIDGLDRTLTVGQMQGKFQLQVLARCGHAVHEVNFFLIKNQTLGSFIFFSRSFY